jgi:hypothetical protein
VRIGLDDGEGIDARSRYSSVCVDNGVFMDNGLDGRARIHQVQ